MVAARINARNPEINKNNLIEIDKKFQLLSSAAIYGANASGKSNIMHAFSFMRYFVLSSSKESQVEDPIAITPFRLSTETEENPSLFEIIFIIDSIQYRYGFEATQKEIVSEWLYYIPKTKEANLFIRDYQNIISKPKFKEGKGVKDKTRPNALFLSVAAQFNGEISGKILNWFSQVGMVSGLDDTAYRDFTVTEFSQGTLNDGIIQLISSLDLGIESILSEDIEKAQVTLPSDMPDELKSLVMNSMGDKLTTIKTIHKKWGKDNSPISTEHFDLEDESEGTQKLFFLAGPILHTLQNGRVLIIDEMEARLHPLITLTIIKLFNSLKTNPKRAQLVFTTHDTNLLSNKIFRRDQIWFVEKDNRGCSHLYSLAELKVRNDASFEKDYIDGRYGAIPFIGNIRHSVIGE
ncbi:MAG: ATP-binding protein [Chloroflexi bacterium]|nr:MAG: ATP-binding protein [Chloroflexota bacterium]